MQPETPLDYAHQKMDLDGGDTANLVFYERLVDAELFLLLEKEADETQILPQVFPVEGDQYALVFDTEERLAEFAGTEAFYAALSGRLIVRLLAGKQIGLGVNLGVATSSILLPASAVDWLSEMVGVRAIETTGKAFEVSAPVSLPKSLLDALNVKLSLIAGLAQTAYLVTAKYDDETQNLLLAVIDANPLAERSIADAVNEALVFSGTLILKIDVAFFKMDDPVCEKLARVGLGFDLPEPEAATPPTAPGMDPTRPPRLR